MLNHYSTNNQIACQRLLNVVMKLNGKDSKAN